MHVCTQNIHLVAKWLAKLEKTLEQYSVGSHEDYRVYMSAEPAPMPSSHIIPQGRQWRLGVGGGGIYCNACCGMYVDLLAYYNTHFGRRYFRVWFMHELSTGILESSIKITNEPPTGMMANLHKALDNFSQVGQS